LALALAVVSLPEIALDRNEAAPAVVSNSRPVEAVELSSTIDRPNEIPKPVLALVLPVAVVWTASVSVDFAVKSPPIVKGPPPPKVACVSFSATDIATTGVNAVPLEALAPFCAEVDMLCCALAVSDRSTTPVIDAPSPISAAVVSSS
jgi:hypothetical protein